MAAPLQIVEIGDKPFVKNAYPAETTYFSTTFDRQPDDAAAGRYSVHLGTLATLYRALHDPGTSLIVCHPTFYAPWHWRWLSRALFDRRVLRGHVPLVRAYGPQLLRSAVKAPVAVVDQEDLPLINRSNFFLLDRCDRYFKRELPADRWRLMVKTGHPNLPTPRFRKIRRFAEGLAKLRPISMGLPMDQHDPFAIPQLPKTADIFFAGRTDASSWVRQTGFQELMNLKARGFIVDIPDRPLPRDEFYRRCASAWLTWSPEGYGWECFRHYEALACGSVPVCNVSPLERHMPLRPGQHAVFYPVEAGGLSETMTFALADKDKLQEMAGAGREHVRQHHTPGALARYIVTETLGSRPAR